MHKLRQTMVRTGRHRLSRVVEVDETFVGGEHQGTTGRQTDNKALVVTAGEVLVPKSFGRVQMRQTPDASAATLTPFVCDVIGPGAMVRADERNGHSHIKLYDYVRVKHIIAGPGTEVRVVLPGVSRVAALLNSWLLSIYQGAVSNKHLDWYPAKRTFRFNRRSSHAGPSVLPVDAASHQSDTTTYRAIAARPKVISDDSRLDTRAVGHHQK